MEREESCDRAAALLGSDIRQAGAPVIEGAMARANQQRDRREPTVRLTTGHANRSGGEQALQNRHVGGKSALDAFIDCPKADAPLKSN
jgi:hypothetical protein